MVKKMPPAGPVALVTGAAGNVGRALAAVLAAQGWRIAAVDRMAAPLEALIATFPDPTAHLPLPGVDLTDPSACVWAVDQTLQRFGRLDGVGHTVGGFAMAPLEQGGLALFGDMHRINVTTTANIFAAAVPPMRAAGQGALVAISAMAGLRAGAGMHAYAAAKAGVLRLTESLAEEVKAAGLRVNAVLPGTLDTAPNRAAMPDADTSLWVQPAQVAAVMAFLLSDAASGVTGAAVPVTAKG